MAFPPATWRGAPLREGPPLHRPSDAEACERKPGHPREVRGLPQAIELVVEEEAAVARVLLVDELVQFRPGRETT